jgi:CubicO group peptidase (beta-lactamase class C family)
MRPQSNLLQFVVAAAIVIKLISAGPAFADPQDRQQTAAEIAAFLRPAGAQPLLNGVVLVSEGDQVVVRDSLGMARYETREPMTPDAVFQAASTAKPITATAVLQLRDAGKLKLDDKVADLLIGFPWTDVTVRQLLNHTSGLPDQEIFQPIVRAEPNKIFSNADVIPALAAWPRPADIQPGAKFRYSNIGYQLLSLIVERQSGQTFADYVREHILQPAGMTSSFVLGDTQRSDHRQPVANHMLAVMYRETPEDVTRVSAADERTLSRLRYDTVTVGSTLGDQNLFTTVDDLRRFDRALRDGRILSLASQEEAYRPTMLVDGAEYQDAEEYQNYQTRCSYGLGWEVCQHPRFGRIVGHAGYNRGIGTQFYRNLDRDQVVVAFDNTDNGQFAAVAASVANILNDTAPLEVSIKRSLTRAFGARLLERGFVDALILFNRDRADAEHWSFTEVGLNRLGYDFLRTGHPDEAEQVFSLNLALHPPTASWYDSWGDALMALDRTEEAKLAFMRALELDPSRKDTAEKLQRLGTNP